MRNDSNLNVDYYLLENSLQHQELSNTEAKERVDKYLLANRITKDEADTLVNTYLM